MDFTVDTGATRTLISYDLFCKIPEHLKPDLITPTALPKITTADGSPLKYHGTAVFELQLGPVAMKRPLLITDLADDILLGTDILQRDEEGPADLLLSENKMILRGCEVPLRQVASSQRCRIRKVKACDHYVIPGRSEKIVDIFPWRGHS